MNTQRHVINIAKCIAGTGSRGSDPECWRTSVSNFSALRENGYWTASTACWFFPVAILRYCRKIIPWAQKAIPTILPEKYPIMTAMTKDKMLKLCRSKLRTALVLYCTELYFEHAKVHRQKKQNLSLKHNTVKQHYLAHTAKDQLMVASRSHMS